MAKVSNLNINTQIIKRIKGLTEAQFNAICEYLNEEVENFVISKEWFSFRDIGGKERFEWLGTPLYPLYEVYNRKYTDLNNKNPNTYDLPKDAIETAGVMAGKILKAVLIQRERQNQNHFQQKSEDLILKYQVIQESNK